MHEYMKILVVEHKMISYQYFMDEMQQYEIELLIDLIPWADKMAFERMRYQVWASLKPYLKNKKTTPEQLLPFYTDNVEEEEKEQPLPDKELAAIRERIGQIYFNKQT